MTKRQELNQLAARIEEFYVGESEPEVCRIESLLDEAAKLLRQAVKLYSHPAESPASD